MPNYAVSSNAHNLNDGRAQALEALSQVSDRLSEILGDVPGDGTHRNENGELVNEEGLPIIDITEPIDDLDTPSLSAATEEDEVLEDNYPEPIATLSPEALAISRKHRDKILELLEEEEAREERRTRQEQQVELLQKREAARSEMQKRMVTQSAELEHRRRAKEMEKKMAKALISGMGKAEPTTANKADYNPSDKKEAKRVTFAETPSQATSRSSQSKQHVDAVTWGDVVPGRLSEKQRVASRSRPQPMKMDVVERPSVSKQAPRTSTPPLPEPPNPGEPIGDSDDDSDPEEHSDSTVTLESGEEDIVLSAHRHRELALEYHKRREALISSAGSVKLKDVVDGTTNIPSNGWDNEDVPLEATLAHLPPKPPVSKFKATFANSRPTDPSQDPPDTHTPLLDSSSTFSASVLPPNALAKSIKMGKLVDGRLVAGDGEEGEEEREAREEEEIRKLLLKSMEDYSGIAAQVMGSAGSYWAESKADIAGPSSSTTQSPSKPKTKPKASRFRVNRTQSRGPSETVTSPFEPPNPPRSTPTTIHRTEQSGITTPLSSAERSSPKLTQQERSTHPDILPSDLTIIDSPSFAPVRGGLARNASAPRGVVDSPSFKHIPDTDPPSSIIASPSFSTRPMNNIIESPSFLRPAGSSATGSQASLSRSSPGVVSPPSVHPNQRQPTTMADSVAERTPSHDLSVEQEVKPQRVSRFKAERSGGL